MVCRSRRLDGHAIRYDDMFVRNAYTVRHETTSQRQNSVHCSMPMRGGARHDSFNGMV